MDLAVETNPVLKFYVDKSVAIDCLCLSIEVNICRYFQ